MAEIVINDIEPLNGYTAAGGETGFDFDFPIFDADDLVVLEIDTDGVATTLVRGTDYSVTGTGAADGGSITLDLTPYPDGATEDYRYVLYRDLAVSRGTDFLTGGDFKAETVNRELDKLIMMIQQNELEVKRALGLQKADAEDEINFKIETAAERASKVLVFGSAGNTVESKAISDLSLATAVSTTGLANNDFLVYVSASAAFENKTPANARTAMGLGDLAVLDTVAAAQIDTDAIITDKILADNVTDAEIRLTNNGYLTARNAAGDGDINIVKVNASDEVEFAGAVKINGKMTNVTDPTAAQDAATKAYVDGVAGTESEVDRPTLSNNATDADHDIDISAGKRLSADGSKLLVLASALTKQIDATWSAGTNAGGLSSSLTAPAVDTWYHVFLIEVAGAVDVGFDTDIDAANLIADHSATAYRRIGSVLTDGSANITGFYQIGNKFRFKALQVDVSAATQGSASRDTRTISTPLGIVVEAEISLQFACPASSNYGILVTDLVNEADSAVSLTNATMYIGGNGGYQQGDIVICNTNTSSQIGVRATGAGGTVNIATRGWMDAAI